MEKTMDKETLDALIAARDNLDRVIITVIHPEPEGDEPMVTADSGSNGPPPKGGG
jgi:hypothetical protein